MVRCTRFGSSGGTTIHFARESGGVTGIKDGEVIQNKFPRGKYKKTKSTGKKAKKRK